MRRLAAQSREDRYSSQRDYQTLFEQQSIGLRVDLQGTDSAVLRFVAHSQAGTNTSFVGCGVFLRTSEPTELSVTLSANGSTASSDFSLGPDWSRAAVILEHDQPKSIEVVFEWAGSNELDIWGLAAGPVELPDGIIQAAPTIEDMTRPHVAPETFYLPHEVPLGMDIVAEASTKFISEVGPPITTKKCSYCGRFLPLDMDRLGALSFHKHLAKNTKHQNECRSCKKWRINNEFNPLRTTDQLHESSVITRERKLFLREPEILQRIKDRSGAGLKSQIWEKFERKCFRCKRELALSEVQLDHTRPLAYLWPIDEHATCLCPECNNLKKEKFPVDFYSPEQLRELSEICGLDEEILRTTALNETELQRLIEELPTFAAEWEPRTFAACARKIRELRPDIDLFNLLEKRDPQLHEDLRSQLRERPPTVTDL